MARGINKVIIIGNVGQAPELRHFGDNQAVVNISVATSENWKDKQTGETKEKTEWHRIVFYRRLAEIVSEYVTKGMKIYVEGKLETHKWQDKDGHDRYTTQIIANQMQMLDGGNRPQSNQQQNQQQAPAQQTDAQGNFDDDIPF